MSGDGPDDLAGAIARLERRAARERQARKEAERLLTEKSRELFDALSRTRESERRLQLALWASREGIWSWSARDDRATVEQLELGDGLVGRRRLRVPQLLALVHPDDASTAQLAWRLALAGAREDIDTACRLRHGDGWRWLRLRGRVVERDAEGRALRVAGTVKDITSQRAAEDSLRLMAHAFAHTHDALAVLDDRWVIVEGNGAMATLLGCSVDQLRGRRLLDDLGLPLDRISASKVWRGELLLRAKGRVLPVDVAAVAVEAHSGPGQHVVVALQDASERKRAEAELRHRALHDTLTGLPNRAALQARLEGLLASGVSVGVLFIDLDGFKLVNDSAGHEAGDGLLLEVANRLSRVLDPPSFGWRWGGDEFVVVLPLAHSEADVRRIGRTILERCRQTVQAGSRMVAVGASLGAALAPRDGRDAATLLRRADAAMYSAKQGGRNRIEFYEPLMEGEVQRRADLLTQLRLDAEHDRFTFDVQSIFDREDRLVGGEMLMRWRTDNYGAVSPAEFIPLAEEAGLMPRMGLHALTTAVSIAGQLANDHAGLRIAVNVSAKQLREPAMFEVLLRTCDQAGVSTQRIELELTESAYVHDLASAVPVLRRLHEAGFGLALDDFGTGYSSLSQLRDLPFGKVKIDRGFVRDMTVDARAARLMEGIVQLCSGMGIRTVAEGVETAEQLEALRGLGIDQFQGWHLARPAPMAQWLEGVLQPG